jgi:pyroglutamyl-peptidase
MKLLVALELNGRRVAVVGAGRVGMRKARKLAALGAQVRLIDPAGSPWPGHEVRARAYQLGDLDDCDLAFACTGIARVDNSVAAEARSRHIWCNRADGRGDLDMVAMSTRGAATFGVHAGGDPRRAVQLRDRIDGLWSDIEDGLPVAVPGTEQIAGVRGQPSVFVLTGFGPFPGVGDNPTPQIATEAASRVPWLDVRVLEVPTVFGEAWPVLEARLESIGPRLAGVFSLGVAIKRRQIDIETVAFNRRALDRPDAAGRRAPGIAVRPGEAPERHVTFDASAFAQRLRDQGHAVRTSPSAGDYLCNEIFYELLAWQRRVGFRGAAGFVHVPALSSLSLGPSAAAIAALLSLANTGMPATSDV